MALAWPHRVKPARTGLCVALGLSAIGLDSWAADDVVAGELRLDRPTVHALGVQLLVSEDDNRNASVALRYRAAGETAWREGMPLWRVRPENVLVSVPEQFAGSVFDLSPGTSYEIELDVSDPDGGDATLSVSGATRAIPPELPASPSHVAVTTAPELSAALASAAAGDVITLAAGTYAGTFSISASGTASDPIVIRGADALASILDGEGCTGCNILEVYGSYVHVEHLTIAHGERALRFQTPLATNNVARRLTIFDVRHGIGSRNDQADFYVCDNDISGRLVWPWPFEPGSSQYWDERGVDMNGDGHVVCHNILRGFGDPVVNKTAQARSWDIYGNDIYDAQDGLEVDESEGNVRVWHNRFTNVMAPISIQPVYGGPAYILRNVSYNSPDEQVKLKSLGGTNEPSGAIILHNTFVSPVRALNLQTPITQHDFVVHNNLFVGPQAPSGRTVDWTASIDNGRFDYNGYYPDGGFWFGVVNGQNRVYADFAEVLAAGEVEAHGVLLDAAVFAAGDVGPTDAMATHAPKDLTLAMTSAAVDAGMVLAGVNAHHLGPGPDLGALERGCPPPIYGPRALGSEHLTNAIDCGEPETPGGEGGAGGMGGAGMGGDAGAGGSGDGGSTDPVAGDDADSGCACTSGPARALRGWWLAPLIVVLRRRRRTVSRATPRAGSRR